MRLSSITIQNFRCFGPDKTVIMFDDFTAFIGANGTGKTALLIAISRMFGTPQSLREIHLDDFHLPSGNKLEDFDERNFSIEVRIDFPELKEKNDIQSCIPEYFAHMIVSSTGGDPYCRIRLTANWTRTELEGGDIESKMVYIKTPSDDPQEADFVPISPRDRSRIQVFYVPSSRDASRQLANASGTLLNQLLKAIKWDPQVKEDIKKSADEVKKAFVGLQAVDLINQTSAQHWQELYDDQVFTNPSLSFMGTDFEEILRDTKIVFNPTHGRADQPIDRLSDGQQSLFYFAFINTIFSIRRQVFEEHHKSSTEHSPECQAVDEPNELCICDHICYETLRPAPLTIFAVEEPENHLAPHLLGRIVTQLQQIANSKGAQVFVTSHSPSIVARVDPEQIRYFRTQQDDRCSDVRCITLPESDSDAFKYVKQAVRAYPELYFSRLVILGEGESEDYLLKRLALLSGRPLDTAFVSVVPLGGRFVSHLWRLMRDLGIPHLTLLDLDAERHSGGWHTIHYVITELLQYLSDDDKVELLTVKKDSVKRQLTDEELENMPARKPNAKSIAQWANRLENFGVYLSQPLDIDFTMLFAYPERYKAIYDGHPRGLSGKNKDDRIQQAIRTVLGAEGGDGSTFANEEKELFPWYSYLFLGKGKPTTHALAWMQDEEILHADSLPAPLNRLFAEMCSILQASGVED